jgi:hypothetical protein
LLIKWEDMDLCNYNCPEGEGDRLRWKPVLHRIPQFFLESKEFNLSYPQFTRREVCGNLLVEELKIFPHLAEGRKKG